VQAAAARAKLPLAELALPALRRLSPNQFRNFKENLRLIIESDRKIDLFEFVLQKFVCRHLEPHFAPAPETVAQYYSGKALYQEMVVVLSALAHVGHTKPEDASTALSKGLPYLRVPGATIALLPREECGLAEIDGALTRLSLAVPQIKKNFLEACVQTLGADGVIREPEAELLRAIADTLDCPIPPLVCATP
jgi:hypothetical protein